MDATPLPNRLYRADHRTPEEIKEAGGFDGWVSLSLEESKNLIRFFVRTKNFKELNPAFKEKIKNGQLSVKTDKQGSILADDAARTPLDLTMNIIASGDRKSPGVSTAPNKECGGFAYDGRFIYSIDTAKLGLKVVDWKTATGMPGTPIDQWPDLVINADTLDNASRIALRAKAGGEVSFLTPIPKEAITTFKPRVKEPNHVEEEAMSGPSVNDMAARFGGRSRVNRSHKAQGRAITPLVHSRAHRKNQRLRHQSRRGQREPPTLRSNRATQRKPRHRLVLLLRRSSRRD